MIQAYLLFAVISAVALLLFMVLRLKINAFISLLVASIFMGVVSGMPLSGVLDSIQKGMGGTLGFVATVVGLGAIFGQMLESSGGAQSMARYLIGKFGNEKATWAMVITGFFVAIPVFFDVGFIILVPIVYTLSRDTKRSVLYYGIPLLAGLAVTHSFIPPTPGPVAVAEIVNAQLGYVILFGFIVAIPVSIIAGPIFGKFISKKLRINAPEFLVPYNEDNQKSIPSFGTVIGIIAVPLVLILTSTVCDVLVKKNILRNNTAVDIINFLGHPFSALIIATLIALYFLGMKRGFNKKEILELSTKALGPAGVIILITGAGGVFKQVLVDSGIGKILAESMSQSNISPILLAWLLAAVVRITQGSSTVAMITAAGLIAPIIGDINFSEIYKALIVLSIASGATILSHVNDSGFWLVGKYFGMTEKQTLQSWTVMETIISVAGLLLVLLISLFI